MAAGSLVGLDIGATSILAVESRASKGGPAVVHSGQIPLPAGAVQNGVIQDEKAVTAALRELWTLGRFSTRRVVLGVTSSQVVVRAMSVSNVPRREMRKSLPFQVKQILPFAVERSLLDFQPLENPGEAKTVRGLLVAAPKELVLTAVRTAEQAGLHVVQVDLASFALLRAASWLDEQIEAIVDIGAQATTVVVHHNGEPLIVRTLPRGGAEITEMIAKRLNLPNAEAEALKCRVGLYPEAIASGNGPEIAEVINDAVRPLMIEIRNSFAYLNSGDQQQYVSRLMLSGGGSQLPGLTEALESQLGVEVLQANPAMRLRDGRIGEHTDVEQFRACAAIAIGLTLGAV